MHAPASSDTAVARKLVGITYGGANVSDINAVEVSARNDRRKVVIDGGTAIAAGGSRGNGDGCGVLLDWQQA